MTLFSKSRTEILRQLFGITPNEFHIREIVRQSNLNVSTIRQELKTLSEMNLITSIRKGNRLYCTANQNHPLYSDLRNIVIKSFGIIDVLQPKFSTIDVEVVFIYGSFARNEAKANSDIDIMVIGNLELEKLTECLVGVPEQLEREVNPIILSANKLEEKLFNNDPFITEIMNAPKMFIKGSAPQLQSIYL